MSGSQSIQDGWVLLVSELGGLLGEGQSPGTIARAAVNVSRQTPGLARRRPRPLRIELNGATGLFLGAGCLALVVQCPRQRGVGEWC